MRKRKTHAGGSMTCLRRERRAKRTFDIRVLVSTVLVVTAPLDGRADYTCHALDVPGSTYTQIFGINNADQVAALSDLGAWIHTGEGWQQIVPPPDSGYAAVNLGALGVNDYGVVVGGAGPVDGSSGQGFIVSGGAFRFFRAPLSGLFTNPRAIGNNGVVVGTVEDPGVGFIYNPFTDPSYPRGFTLLAPAFADGTAANETIPHGMNGLGQFVGSVRFPGQPRFAFLYDPGWQSHGRDRLMTLFRFGEQHSAARGINVWGRIVGFVRDDDGAFHGMLRTNLRDRPIECSALPGIVGVTPEAINDRGVIVGVWSEPSQPNRGFIAYPDPADDFADLLEAATGVGPGKTLESLVRLAQASFAAGKVRAACVALAAFRGEVQVLPARKLAPELARAFTAEARAIAAELDCP